MVRRIKNQFTSGSQRKAPDRNSYSGGDALHINSYSRKQHNRSDTLPPTFLSPQGSLLSPSSGPPPSNKWGRAGSSGTLQAVGPYETGGYTGDLNPHARYTRSSSRDEGRREHAGSIWKKELQKGRGSGQDQLERREGPSRSQLLSSHPPPPPIAHQRELLTSYHQPSSHAPSHRHSHSSPSHDPLHRSTTLPVSPESRSSQPQISLHPPTIGHTPTSPSTRRKISYNLAVGESFQRQRHAHTYHHQNVHRKTSADGMVYTEDAREKEFSRSYAPQSTVRSTNFTKSGIYPSYQSDSHSRGYQSHAHAPQRGETVQRSRRNESYH